MRRGASRLKEKERWRLPFENAEALPRNRKKKRVTTSPSFMKDRSAEPGGKKTDREGGLSTGEGGRRLM